MISTQKENRLTKSCLTTGITYKIYTNIFYFKKKMAIFWSFMTVFTSVYLSCEILQSSSFIKNTSHYSNNVSSFTYDLLFSWLIIYFLLKQQFIASQKISDNILYWIFAHLGGLGFALLGEVPFLSGIVITKNWWKHLPLKAIITIIIIGSLILLIGCREIYNSCKDGMFKKSLRNILIVILSYSILLSILIIGEAKDIHYHVHHAIFAGILSIWFIDWKNYAIMIMHAILLGVVVEGINFYGIGELCLFLTKNKVLVTLQTSLFIFIIFHFILLCLYISSHLLK